MIGRLALGLILLLMSGMAAIFAAGHFGIRLPWGIAAPPFKPSAVETAASPKQDADTAAAPDSAKPADAIADAVAALSPPPGQQSTSPGRVALDISRISPGGTSVFAGQAAPDSYVTVYENGKPAGTVKADSNGDWSLATEHKFASSDPKLTFEASQTPPPQPEPHPVAEKPAPAQPATASAATSDVMRKFEKLVADAREEARREREATARNEASPAAATSSDTGAKPDDTEVATLKPAAPPSSPSTTAAPVAPSPEEAAPSATVSAPERSADVQAETSDATSRSEPSGSQAAAARTTVIPVPIMFVYNEAKLTAEGERATALLLEYLTLKHLDAIELTGHADERGTHEYNLDLSRERLEAVSALLRGGGYGGNLKLTPKGKSEPYRGVDRALYQGEALFQLDRRVELRIGQ